MGVLIEGRWTEEELPQEIAASGEFKRVESRFRDRITADGSSGFKAEAGRYHLYLAHSCPWAHRVLIFLVLKKLEHAFSVAFAIPGASRRRLDLRGRLRVPGLHARPRQRLPLPAPGVRREPIRTTPAR